MKAWLGALSFAVLAVPHQAYAHANIVSIKRGSGFADATPVNAVGENPGATRGEQRSRALDHVLALWAEQIDSDVTISIDVSFEKLGCEEGNTVLGQAGNTLFFSKLSAPGADPALFYPSALANSLSGYDLEPNTSDIRMELNSSVDDECKDIVDGFYYGFDSNPGLSADFTNVVLHELAHGLGLGSAVDPTSGELLPNQGADPYTAQIRDLDLDLTWDKLTAAQRKQSATNVRRIVWDGPNAARLAATQFALGTPALSLDHPIANYSGAVSDTNFGQGAPATIIRGTLVLTDDCELPTRGAPVAPILLFPETCHSVAKIARTSAVAGAVGAVLMVSSPFDSPALPITVIDVPQPVPVQLPLVTLSEADGRSLRGAIGQTSVTAAISGAAQRRLGADELQRPLLFASRPSDRGSTISHLDPLVRPDQLMEPFSGPVPTHDLSFTVAMLHDIGWPIACGNGQKNEGEACDDGEHNSDLAPNACRSDCRRARCGDGVRDSGERCDDGPRNSDARANACRTNCQPASCGDGVVDQGEHCDQAARNNDEHPDTCRANCQNARCGDGVIDHLEQCDDGADNSDTRPDACRTDCRLPRCGDGVVDEREACDGAPDCTGTCEQPPLGEPEPRGSEPAAPVPVTTIKPNLDVPPIKATAVVQPQPAPVMGVTGCGCRVAQRAGSSRLGIGWIACGLAVAVSVRRRRRRPYIQ